jgi:hypothetical protein
MTNMADLNLPALHAELLHALDVARKAHDQGVTALRTATTPEEKERATHVLYGLADTVNAVQGCVYTTGYVVRASAAPVPALDAGAADAEDAARWRWLVAQHDPADLPIAQVVWKRDNDPRGEWVNLIDGRDLIAHVDAASGVPVSPATYRLLERNEVMEMDDEVMGDDTVTWFQLPNGFAGRPWHDALQPMRRRSVGRRGSAERNDDERRTIAGEGGKGGRDRGDRADG